MSDVKLVERPNTIYPCFYLQDMEKHYQLLIETLAANAQYDLLNKIQDDKSHYYAAVLQKIEQPKDFPHLN